MSTPYGHTCWRCSGKGTQASRGLSLFVHDSYGPAILRERILGAWTKTPVEGGTTRCEECKGVGVSTGHSNSEENCPFCQRAREARRVLYPFLHKLVRPVTRLSLHVAGDAEDLPLLESHFGGRPYAEAGERWPSCAGCKKDLTFVCQLDLSRGWHEKRPGLSLLTFFFCRECFSPEADTWALRAYGNPSAARAISIAPGGSPTRTIRPCLVVAAEGKSLPDTDGISKVAPEVVETSRGLHEDDPIDPYRAAVEDMIGELHFDTFVGGYPHWIQNDRTPSCPLCTKPMSLLAQLDSSNDAGCDWGDVGCLYLFCCGSHPTRFALASDSC